MTEKTKAKEDILKERRRLVDELVGRWKDHLFMKPFLERTNDRNNAAALLENSLHPPEGVKYDPCVTEVVTRVFNWMMSRRLFGVQAAIAGEDLSEVIFMNFRDGKEPKEQILVLDSQPCEPKVSQLKAKFSYSAADDLSKHHNLHRWSAKQELIAILAMETTLELDRRLLRKATTEAGTVATWDFNAALGDTIMEKYEALYVKLVEISNVIHRKTMRGGANFIVTSPEVSSIFETATGFAPISTDSFASSLGIQYVGTVNSKWRLYKDPLFKTNQMLIGRKGDSEFDCGLCFAPKRLCWWDEYGQMYSEYDAVFGEGGQNHYAALTIENFII